MKKNSKRLVAQPINNANVASMLASIYRDVMFELGMTGSKFSMLLESYSRKAHRNKSNVATANLRNTLKKELLDTKMTWKVFIKGLSFLEVTKISLSMKLTYKDGHVTTHNKKINLDNLK